MESCIYDVVSKLTKNIGTTVSDQSASEQATHLAEQTTQVDRGPGFQGESSVRSRRHGPGGQNYSTRKESFFLVIYVILSFSKLTNYESIFKEASE